jgi:hypothetical protein
MCRRQGTHESGPPTKAVLLVKLGNNAKAEKTLTGFVCNVHPPLRTSFYWIITITEYFASGFIASS